LLFLAAAAVISGAIIAAVQTLDDQSIISQVSESRSVLREVMPLVLLDGGVGVPLQGLLAMMLMLMMSFFDEGREWIGLG